MKNFSILILLSLICFSFGKSNSSSDDLKFIEVKGKKLYYKTKGTANPVVVFVSGLGPTMDDFFGIQNKLAKKNQVICFDRAGVGNSEPMNNERNLENISAELKEFLDKVISNKPFVLVGHSRGGLIARYFASKYPENLKGLVLIDPAIPELINRKRKLRTESEKIDFDNFYNSFCTDSSKYTSTIRSEFKNTFAQDSISVAEKGFLTSIPITLLVSTQVTKDKYSAKEMEMKLDIIKGYLKSAPHIKVIFTSKSGHFIHDDEPKLVVKEIAAILKDLVQ